MKASCCLRMRSRYGNTWKRTWCKATALDWWCLLAWQTPLVKHLSQWLQSSSSMRTTPYVTPSFCKGVAVYGRMSFSKIRPIYPPCILWRTYETPLKEKPRSCAVQGLPWMMCCPTSMPCETNWWYVVWAGRLKPLKSTASHLILCLVWIITVLPNKWTAWKIPWKTATLLQALVRTPLCWAKRVKAVGRRLWNITINTPRTWIKCLTKKRMSITPAEPWRFTCSWWRWIWAFAPWF